MKKLLLNKSKQFPPSFLDRLKKPGLQASPPPRRSTRRRGLIGLEVSEKQANDREKRENASKKEEQAREQPSRTKKKQRIAAEIIDVQATQDFIICTPRT